MIKSAAMALDRACMIRFSERTGDLNITGNYYNIQNYIQIRNIIKNMYILDLGRTASHFYIKYDTVEVFNEKMKPIMGESDVLAMISHSQEFQQLKVSFFSYTYV